jgi:hypothetical protein
VTLAMTHLSSILTAWIVSSVIVGAFCLRVVQRGRRLTRSVPPRQRRWMTAENQPPARR